MPDKCRKVYKGVDRLNNLNISKRNTWNHLKKIGIILAGEHACCPCGNLMAGMENTTTSHRESEEVNDLWLHSPNSSHRWREE